MNDINFITATSRSQQYAMKRWILFTALISTILIIGALCVQLYQWIKLGQLKKDKSTLLDKTKDFDEIMTKKQALLQQKVTFEKQLATLYARKNSPKLPHELLTTLKSASDTTVQLQSISLEKEKLTINAFANQPTHATQFAAHIADKAPITEVKLVALKNHHSEGTNQLLFTVEAKVVIK